MRVALLPLIFVALITFVPLSAQAATFFGPIVPPECNCEDEEMLKTGDRITTAADWGCVMQTVQNLMNFAVAISIIIIVLTIVYAGVMFMLSSTNAHSREAGRKLIGNAVIGTLVVLSAWLVVDFVMKVLYDAGPEVGFGPWSEILAPGGAPRCFQASGPPTPLPSVIDVFTGGGYDGPLGTGTGACDPVLVKAGAAAGGYSISNADANTLACIARFESTCGARNLNYRWGRGSSAAGPFQVLLDGNSRAYENAACYQAAGVSGPLNCDDGFRNGNPIAGSAIVDRCVRAAANLNCSASAAAYILRTQGFGAWVTDPNSAKQRQCINRGGG
ncbi:MAG TPA: pilin [Candidatus Paceibacterota bacterium]|nr:pilin [Candidatus Paceibacterota bacterium]